MRPFSTFSSTLPPEEVLAAHRDSTRTAATWGYLLLRPGMEFVRQRSNFILGWRAAAEQGAALQDGVSAGAVGDRARPPLGSWMILPEPASPRTRTVLPSTDALYGAAHVELDLLGPVVVEVPANIDDRYFSVAIMDAHMNNVAHIGPRWTGHGATAHAIVPPGWDGAVPDGLTVIPAPTVSLCLYNRMLVRHVPGDIDRVRQWQAGLRIAPLAQWGDPDAVVPAVDTAPFEHPAINDLEDAEAYFRIGLDHLRRNPLVRSAEWLSALVASTLAAPEPGDARPIDEGAAIGTRMLDAALTAWPRVNGWMMPDTTLGLPNADVLRSAAFQQFQVGANDAEESVYYFADTDAAGEFLHGGDGAVYQLRIPAGEPRIVPGGYWSVTVYDENSFLSANPIDRYAVRADSPGLRVDPDGTTTIVFAERLPAGVDEANWLPVPPARFRLGIRVYYPDLSTGVWSPPGAAAMRTVR